VTNTETASPPTVEPVDDRERPETRREQKIVEIKPVSDGPFIDFRELWRFRELAGILAWRDFRVRYKQTAVGVGWVVLQPLITTIVFTVVFGKFADFPSGDFPYPIFMYSGVLLWTYFASSLARSSTSLVANAGLVTKVYFPRMLLPAASVVSPLVDLACASTILAGMMIYFDYTPQATIVLAPVFILISAIAALGVGLWFAGVNVRYRDVPYVIPFLIQMWMFLSPVVYDPTALPPKWQWVYALNPMTGALYGWRWAILGSAPPTWGQVLLGSAVGVVFLVVGLISFKRWEPRFADTI
jgi:homopolymeric O-antigen transport system permease protein